MAKRDIILQRWYDGMVDVVPNPILAEQRYGMEGHGIIDVE